MKIGGKLADYDVVISEAFRRLRASKKEADYYDFDKSLLERVVEELGRSKKISKPIKNIPDIKYTYDARKNFPTEISRTGFWAITGRGKSKYRFERIKQNNLIRIPEDIAAITLPEIEVKDGTPEIVAVILGSDEQSTLTRVRYSGLISRFVGFEANHVQGHERTTVSAGQIEIDEVYVGEKAGQKIVLPISAKGGDKDRLSYTQAFSLSLYAQEKPRYKGYVPIPLGITRLSDGRIFIVEFSVVLSVHEITIKKSACYRLT